MDKEVILAVAGSGKTSHIVDSLNSDSRALLITYTQNNFRNLRTKILQRFGYIPNGISLYSYFTFLYSFCFKPLLWRKCGATGLNWEVPPHWTLKLGRDSDQFYFDNHRRVYHNRLAKLLETQGVLDIVNERLGKYFDYLFIDEVQDFAGHDFNLLRSIATARLNLTFVGDFHQHTFDTSRDGNVNSSLHDDLETYVRLFERSGLRVDRHTLNRSYRCSPTVCAFVSENLGIPMESHREDVTPVRFLETKEDARRVLECDQTMKLFYQEHYKYPCLSRNWGASKGDEYLDVCVVLNKTSYKNVVKGRARDLNPKTKNKLYVACTRAGNALYFVAEDLVRECLG